MKYIPPGAKWFLADIVMETTVQDEPGNLVHINLTLIRASSLEEAYERSLQVGQESESSYLSTDGKMVTVRFRGLRDLNVIHEELEHGSEIAYDELEDQNEDQIQQLLRSREELVDG